MRAALVFHQKIIYESGDREELVIWKVPKTNKYPDGIKYRLAYIKLEGTLPAVLYDNHHPKGHHKHIKGKEMPYRFSDINRLIEDFEKSVQEVV